MERRPNHVDEITNEIDRVLAEPVVSIEDSLIHAVLTGRMTAQEANLCLESYERTFNAGTEPTAS